jgi:hypothetical protein
MADYAAAVVELLRPHFPDLADPVVAGLAEDAIRRHREAPQDPFEFIVDNPVSAKWRLKAYGRDRRRVLLACYRVHPSEADAALSWAVNEALQALEDSR